MVIPTGPLPSTCWSAKPIHIGVCGWMNGVYGRLLAPATYFGSPIAWNMVRLEVKVSSPLKAGEGIDRATRLLLPPSQLTTSATYDESSPRTVIRMSFVSIFTGTL